MSALGLGVVVALAAATRGLVIEPLKARYVRWRDNPHRIPTASRNWRGEYVPDLWLRRGRWMVSAAVWIWAALVLVGFAVVIGR